MKVKTLKIGDLTARIPLIQGGMGVGISLSSLAGTVAKCGGIGVISTAQIGYREPDFYSNTLQANLRAINSEMKKAREIAHGGIIGFNIMVALNHYKEQVMEAVKAGADVIISGAGLPVKLPEYIGESNVKIAPIVSGEKAVKVILKYWHKYYGRTADFIVIEGPKAGGHLGFSKDEIIKYNSNLNFDDEVKKIKRVVMEYENLYGDLSANSGGCAIMRDEEFGLAFLEKYQDRLLFGTDMANCEMTFPLGNWLDEQEHAGRLSRSAYEKICRTNAEKLFHL